MVITGTITEASQPSAPSGQFNVMYQDVVITDNAGRKYYGRIGSKQGYQINTPISVTVEQKTDNDGQPYDYFRKYNPQYQGQQSAPREAQQGSPRPPESPNGTKEPDWDAIAEGKVRHGVLCAMLQGGLIVHYPTVLKHTRFIVTGKIPDEPNPGFSDNPEEPEGDIPF